MNDNISNFMLDDSLLHYTVRCAKVNIYVNRYRRCA